ncbi:glyoxylase-like metal-dependent hydrolase (beta-lactamase superfamily II) [Caldalkalibacillus uzonensis]|uniref:Glyoxylase-like metal-dependent hydrolase (Beta-lactamase superfamily II) n=1 Tax=Caldalkalibacillus uzonensis TaxID=353224 RepID=A0ABU0CTJ3_9BACI|nr:MBL fold metallo-hydrolase [Caldalkalibacillus uzonensis]MDQ0339745.1 glyoxylase-like metal-dependent hydrolase (beta-lactamase superfamily II) [Caldalkalibacillus uzonensis]
MLKISQHGDVVQGQLFHKRFPLTVSFFLIDGLLVDTGAPILKQTLKDYFKAESIAQVVLTHHHEDHSGCAGWLKRAKQVPVYMHPQTKRILEAPPSIPMYRKLAWGQMEAVQGVEVGNELETDRFKFKVIDTPGHCQDHISLLEPNHGILFSGDLFVSKVIKYSLRDESVKQMLDSINTLLTYDFEEVYCAHAGRVKNGYQAFREKKAYLEELIEQVLDYYRQGMSIQEIKEKINPKPDWNHYLTMGEFSSYNMVKHIIDEYGSPLKVS